nr:olfactory receptor 13 [Gregopimpla kuwanae]
MLALDQNYLSFNIRSLTMFGMWNPFHETDQKSLVYLYYAVTLFCLAGVTQTSAEIIHVWKSRDDVVMFTQRFTIATGMFSTMVKVVNLWRCRLNIEDVLDLLNWERRQPCNRKFAIYRDKIVTSTIRICRTFSLSFIIMVFWYSVFTYGKLLIYHKGNIDMLPLRPLLHLRSNHSTIYWLLFTLDEATFFYIAGAVASHDSLFMVFLIHVGTQLDLLKRRLESCQEEINDKDSIENDYSSYSLKVECVCRTSFQEQHLNPINELHTCIQHHQKILRYVSIIQSTFSNTLLLQFASSLVMITMIGFQIVGENTLSSNELIETLSLLICALFQLFLYCWFGTDIIAKSESIALSAYSSNWYVSDEKYKQSLKILLCGGQKPMRLRAGYICELSSSTFMNVISKCYSSMALLNRVNE